ncbi:MAG: hypothetical protein AVDCRST_MAG16-805 [uncultured Frankineae bacterium]|uniref:Uncharacterized protein n=1 Tax=uncultured Frankineae bacterium TaxID=437475 RepID=A0A6J4L4A9_9ACTN|nr:MAG: hypothetical protein AVDCRST_MAG16-805 [uncultured Frankineae bacterium]
MSRPSALFAADGVPADLVRAGEPRLRRSWRRAPRTAPATVTRSIPATSLRWWARVLPS